MQSRLQKFFLLTFLSCLFTTCKLSAQITANIQQGCAPLVGVQFTGLPGGVPTGTVTPMWNFNDGAYANTNNPSHTFTLPGTYNVVYNANVSGSPTSQTITIHVFGKPTPLFVMTPPLNGCAPLSVSFTDHSTGGGGTAITGWLWSFGDGGVSNVQNPVHSFNLGGQFDVTLIATDANGCDSAITFTDAVTVSPKPTVIISSNPALLSSCTNPFNVTYNGLASLSNSPIGGGLTYQWDFGNGVTSTNVSPAQTTYTAPPSTYTVSLTCTDNNNCSQTATRTVTIIQPHVRAVLTDSICLGNILTFLDSSFASQTAWNFGDGTPNQNIVPGNTVTHNYAAGGTYTVTATSTLNGCNDQKTFVVVVDEVVANFTTSAPHFTCNPTLLVNYTNTSTGATHYVWDFPTNVPNSTVTNPSVTFSQNSLNQYTIFQDLPLNTQLIAISALGCRDTIRQALDTIHRPTAFFYTNGNEGCAPLSITFTDSSFSGSNIVSYQWHFDSIPSSPVLNGGPNDTIVTHVYATAGVYHPYLVIQNADGCIDTSFYYPIFAADAPTPDFTFSPALVCPQDTVFITNNTNPADSVNHWHVISDNTYFSGCINDPNPGWLFTHAGVHTVTLVGYTHECRGDSTSTIQVTVKGPIATGRYHTQCGADSLTVMFEAFLQDAQGATWDYGDGTTDILTGNGSHTTTHTYPRSGDYNAVLTGVNATTGCMPSVDSLKVKVRSIRASFINDSIVCSGIQTVYDASASHDVMAQCGLGYNWYFTNHASGTPVSLPPFVTPGPTLTQPLPQGIYTIMMWVKDDNECHDTTTGTIRVSGVTAAFALNDSSGCLPAFNMNTIQNSTSDTTITNYSWTFGDGSGVVTGPNPSHTYTAATSPSQNYTVTLTTTNIIGCIDTQRVVISVNAPIPTIVATTNPFVCAGINVNFLSGGVANASNYAWNFGDGTPVQNTPTSTVSHAFASGGTYSVTVAVSDPAGCAGNSTNFASVTIQDYPLAGFMFQNLSDTSTSAACAGSSMIFIDTSIVTSSPVTLHWDLGTGGGIVGSDTVGTTYTAPGVYAVSLIIKTSFLCADTVRDSIYVYGASSGFSIDKPVICKGEVITFDTINPVNVYTWHWDFGDGTEEVAVAPVGHQYNFHPPGGTTNVTLIYWTQDSTCRYSTTQPISIREVIANFDRNTEPFNIPSDTAHCLGIQDVFNNTSLNATSYSWDFGDGSPTTTTTSPTHTYAVADTFLVTLAISDAQYGCKDTLRKEMITYPIPTAWIIPDSVCKGSPAFPKAQGDPGLTYVWHPGLLLSANDSTNANPTANLTQTTTFTLVATQSYGSGAIHCSTLVDTTIYVQQPPAHIDWDTTIIVGQMAPIPGNAGIGMNYLWTPTTDLSCSTCPNPVSTSLTNIVYTAAVSDEMGCFSETNTFTIEVLPKGTVDVPTAFTPDGDGINDIIYVDGWGIKKLIYFRVYNRWGQLLFESNDLKTGWNGYYNGVLQNMETYVYQVSAEMFVETEPKDIKGYFKLIR